MEDIARHILYCYSRTLPPTLPVRAEQLTAQLAVEKAGNAGGDNEDSDDTPPASGTEFSA